MKRNLKPPRTWPPQAQELYSEFRRRLTQRIKIPRVYLLVLDRFFRFQEQAGLGFREFPMSLLDDYLKLYGVPRRKGIAIVLRSWLRFLFQRKELLVPLHEELDYGGPNYKRRAILSHEQVMQLLQLPPLDEPAGLRDRAFLEVAYSTGMRRGELLALDLPDVDMHSGWIHVRNSKNTHQRMLPLTRWALHFLTRYLHEARPELSTPLSQNALWLNSVGSRLGPYEIGKRIYEVYKVRENLGFSVIPHQLRHACATHLLTGGASIRDVQVLLGHCDIRSTEIYTHITPIYLRSVHERCHPRNNGVMADLGIENPEPE